MLAVSWSVLSFTTEGVDISVAVDSSISSGSLEPNNEATNSNIFTLFQASLCLPPLPRIIPFNAHLSSRLEVFMYAAVIMRARAFENPPKNNTRLRYNKHNR